MSSDPFFCFNVENRIYQSAMTNESSNRRSFVQLVFQIMGIGVSLCLLLPSGCADRQCSAKSETIPPPEIISATRFAPHEAEGLIFVANIPRKVTQDQSVDVAIVNSGPRAVYFSEGSELIDPHFVFRREGTNDWRDVGGEIISDPFLPLDGETLSHNFLVTLEPREGRLYQLPLNVSLLRPGIYQIAIIKRQLETGVVCWLGKIEVAKSGSTN